MTQAFTVRSFDLDVEGGVRGHVREVRAWRPAGTVWATAPRLDALVGPDRLAPNWAG